MDAVNLTASCLVLVNGSFGVVFNSLVIFIWFAEKQEKTSFNLICLTRAINNLIVLLFNFLLLTFPVTLLTANFYPIPIESFIICTTINLYMVNEYQTVLIALNRFVAIYFPFYYSKICSVKITSVILGIFYAERGYASVMLVYRMHTTDCGIFFNPESFVTEYQNESCKSVMTNIDNGPLYYILVAFLLTILLNMITFGKVLKYYHNTDTQNSTPARKNIRLFFQTILQDSLYVIDVLFTFKLSQLSTHRFWYFISASFVWESIHTLDGVVMLMFSDRLSLIEARLFRKSTSVSVGRAPEITVRISNTMPEVR